MCRTAGRLLLIVVAGVLVLSACREDAAHQASISRIDFPDPNMRACVDTAGATYVDEVIALNCLSFGIFDLTGMENFTEIRSVNFAFNALGPHPDSNGIIVVALEPMRNLSKLEFVNVEENFRIRDPSPLGGLANLVSLNMSRTEIDDAGLTGFNSGTLTSLELLNLGDLQIRLPGGGISYVLTNISPLASLTSLTNLDLRADGMGAVTAGVASLTTLSSLREIVLDGHIAIPCADLDTLRAALPGTVVRHTTGCP